MGAARPDGLVFLTCLKRGEQREPAWLWERMVTGLPCPAGAEVVGTVAVVRGVKEVAIGDDSGRR